MEVGSRHLPKYAAAARLVRRRTAHRDSSLSPRLGDQLVSHLHRARCAERASHLYGSFSVLDGRLVYSLVAD